ncbi:MAG: glycosyltransferase [Novosphingobium sp.]
MNSDPASPALDGETTISVVMPARNAEQTIAIALDSLLAQEFPNWRAIIIDDGSTDQTRSIAQHYVERDSRFQLIDGPQRGAGAARNAGLAAIAEPWVLFLDSDDTLDPAMMRRMMAALAEEPRADAVHCGWTFTDWEGNPISTARCIAPGPDLFPPFSRYCAFAIHACIFRRPFFDKAGGFDEALTTSEDFDLWQRIARLGAYFIGIDEYLVTYRIRDKLSWFDAARFLDDALRVVDRGHRADPRLSDQPLPPTYVEGMAKQDLFPAQVHMVVWAAGLQIARGIDATPLLARLPPPVSPLVDSNQLADSLLRGIPLARCRPTTAWLELWPEIEHVLVAFMQGLQNHLGAPDLAQRIVAALELRVVKELEPLLGPDRKAIFLNSTAAVAVEVHGEIEDLQLPGIERAVCFIFNHGHHFGPIILPVFHGTVAAIVLRDAIAAQFAWPLLESLFSVEIYPALTVEPEPNGWTIGRLGPLVRGLERDPGAPGGLHDAVGWTIFVQELLGLPDWSVDQLYDWSIEQPDAVGLSFADGPVAVELSGPLPTLINAAGEVELEVKIGGATAFLTRLLAENGEIPPARIRAAILDRGKMELARIAVREAIVGYVGDVGVPLRERLQTAAHREHADVSAEVIAGTVGGERLRAFVAKVAGELPDNGIGSAIIGTARIGDAAQNLRRAELPASIAAELPAGLRPLQPAILVNEAPASRCYYLPDLITHAASAPISPSPAGTNVGNDKAGIYGRHFFEALFAKGADPWKYTSPYEQTKYEQTLSLIPRTAREKALEIGCAEGHFTIQLAPLVGTLLATDISELALARTADICRGFDNIAYRHFDLAKDDLPGTFDLIVCSELLYYMGDLSDLAEVGAKLARGLNDRGYLVTAHANLVVDEPDVTGFDWRMPYGAKTIGETFAQAPGLVFEWELWTPLYRIQLFRKGGLMGRLLRRNAKAPRKKIIAQNVEPVPEVARHILWNGGEVAAEEREVLTWQLPILMYHAVSESGPEPLARWRVTPAAFEAQLSYLRGAGFEPTSFEEWRAARESFTPLPGRRVLITFDDVYADFEANALPVLLRHRFPATLFVPAEKVGLTADWDAWSGDCLRLIDWSGLERARDAGMRVGSHGANHRELAGLASADVAEELWRSRARIESRLGVEVDALAYPSGSTDEIVEHLAAACGYRHAVTTTPGASPLQDRDFALSRVEVSGHWMLEDFIRQMTV